MRARLAVLLAVAGASGMVASLFFHWYEISGQGGSVTMTGWQAFEFVDVLLVLAALVVFAGLLRPWGRVMPLVGLVAVAAVAINLVEPPPLLSAYEQGGDVEVKREIGAWLGLAGAALVLVAGLLRPRERRDADSTVSDSNGAAVTSTEGD